MYYKSTKFDKKNVWALFQNIDFFFLCELPLILRVDRKWKKQTGDVCKGTQDVECEQDWSVGLGATLSGV